MKKLFCLVTLLILSCNTFLITSKEINEKLDYKHLDSKLVIKQNNIEIRIDW